MRRLHRDHWAGLLLVVVGIVFGIAARERPLGTMMEIGAGLFPLALSVVLACLGLVIVLAAPRAPVPFAVAPDWRGWSCIVGGMMAFLGLGYGFGLAPGTFACVFIAAFGDRGTRLRGALLLAASVTAVGVLVFSRLLQVPFPVLQWGPG